MVLALLLPFGAWRVVNLVLFVWFLSNRTGSSTLSASRAQTVTLATDMWAQGFLGGCCMLPSAPISLLLTHSPA